MHYVCGLSPRSSAVLSVALVAVARISPASPTVLSASTAPLSETTSAQMLQIMRANVTGGSGGKRLRPMLVLLGSQALGFQGNDHIKLAAIIEFLHTATLLHDDVVDKSVLRRGRATANNKWGNAPSVLVGDFLYS